MIDFRRAKRGDAPIVLEIRRRAILAQCNGYYPRELLEAWVAGEVTPEFTEAVERHFLVAEEDGSVVATGILDPLTGKIDAVFVDPARMGQGGGSCVMQHLESRAMSLGIAVLTLDATLNAAPFYRSLGYVGDQPSAFHSPRGFSLACVPMIKRLEAQN